MRTIKRATLFKKDFKKILANPLHTNDAPQLLSQVVALLADDKTLPEKNRDHELIGSWQDHRECHIKPDLLLIYQKYSDILRLVRLGSHSELFK
jgi:mRNA interferase YafQ